jgi:aminopeptidase N
LWLKEGFATYYEFLSTARVKPEWRMDDQFLISVTDILRFDSKEETRPIYLDVKTPDEIDDNFDPDITYGKVKFILLLFTTSFHIINDVCM